MATIGNQLLQPENGWKRYSNMDSNILYIGSWITLADDANFWSREHHDLESSSGGQIQFKFKGTKIRLIDHRHPNRCSTLKAIIDGELFDFSEYGTSQHRTIVFEKIGLENTIHTVELIQLPNSTGIFVLDAIDIDDTGELLPYAPTAPINLIAIAGDSQVALSWTAITGATGYNVKRSTAAGGPYTAIATNITGTSYVDTTVTNRTTYYYVVTAVDSNGNESSNSNEASATPKATSGHGLLRVTMNDSSEREYELSDDAINQFIEWCNRTVGTGSSLYTFNKTYNVGEFKSRKEYLLFEKIISFEVMELTK
ncbi:hypothetical protein [Pelosinus propionicus]|uniref:Fibronectin type-III domain-containing protein n=1 Tax=Pelosinus propionicus DSM 13327 TaxID=1123291 RepID=A0A1I4N7W2_9FIRM|nr:hypothetical protein [Pelosinus propionicus]SFM11485.1 hypothetical protein SAMN04490355_10426 [Pelosinus propionicus DSM 13327]